MYIHLCTWKSESALVKSFFFSPRECEGFINVFKHMRVNRSFWNVVSEETSSSFFFGEHINHFSTVWIMQIRIYTFKALVFSLVLYENSLFYT